MQITLIDSRCSIIQFEKQIFLIKIMYILSSKPQTSLLEWIKTHNKELKSLTNTSKEIEFNYVKSKQKLKIHSLGYLKNKIRVMNKLLITNKRIKLYKFKISSIHNLKKPGL